MNALLMEVVREGYYTASDHILPELVEFGVRDQVELPLSSGFVVALDVIRYEHRSYVIGLNKKGKQCEIESKSRLTIL